MKYVSNILIEEAVRKIRSHKIMDSVKLKKITDFVVKEMCLEEDEIETVKSLLSTPDLPVEIETPDNFIEFSTLEDLNQGLGMLMLKGIPWSSKTETFPFIITFPNNELLVSAQETLRKKWNMVDAQQRTVGVIQFDNLKDYEKTLDFLEKSNMLVTYGNKISPVMDDYQEETVGGYSAISKQSLLDKDADPEKNIQDRIASVRKVWK